MEKCARVPMLLAMVVGAMLVAPAGAEEIKIDRYEVTDTSVSTGRAIVFRDFSVENTDFGKMKKQTQREAAETMRNTAPLAFREAFKRQLAESGAFSDVEVLEEGADVPEGALVVEGEFTELNPGSRAKRYMVGMGAGRSKICIAGRVLESTGETLVKFEDCRSGAMGWFGGRSEGMMSQDVYLSAQNLANFVTAWVNHTLPRMATDKRPS
jgi:hypothetical protein